MSCANPPASGAGNPRRAKGIYEFVNFSFLFLSFQQPFCDDWVSGRVAATTSAAVISGQPPGLSGRFRVRLSRWHCKDGIVNGWEPAGHKDLQLRR